MSSLGTPDQLSLLDSQAGMTSLNVAINVASVVQRSPFRYPGGKTWLVPRVQKWCEHVEQRIGQKPSLLLEPFAGGGSVSLGAACEGWVQKARLVELDHNVAAVWQAIITDGDGKKLAKKITAFDVTLANVQAELKKTPKSVVGRAFQTILRNRVNRGGIMAAGAGLMKSGENGRGLKSRWYPETLEKRLLEISKHRASLEFVEGDAFAEIAKVQSDTSAICFIDPPYTAGGKNAGSRLYAQSGLGHDKLFQAAAGLAGDFLMTYDDSVEVRALAQKYGFQNALVAMKSTHNAPMKELLIGRDLSWI